MKIIFRLHALKRMIERDISENDVVSVLERGTIIEKYPDDTPYPSCLKLGFVGVRPIHVVSAASESETIVITVYEPSINLWKSDLSERRNNK